MQIVLYYAPFACSLVPYATLTEAGADFEVRPLNMRKKQHLAADYVRINPKHKVPLLVVDGRTLSENVAIQLWIARAFPQAKLLPADPWEELQAISILAWCASGIHPYLSRINGPSGVSDLPGSEDSVKRLAQEKLFETFRIADDMLAGREFFFDHFTAADAHFFWCFRRGLQLGLDQTGFTHCVRHFERLGERDSLRRVVAYETEVQAAFAPAA